MGRLTKGEFTTAVRTLRRNKGRSLFTMLGIIFAVASVVTVVGVSQGVTDQISEQTNQLGKDVVTVLPGQVSTGGALNNFGSLAGQSSGGSISQADLITIHQTPGAATVLPLSIVAGGVTSSQDGRQYNIPVIGTTPDFPALFGLHIAYGSFFDNTGDAVNKVVLGSNVASLFDQNVPLGQTVTILGQQFIVSGILTESPGVAFAADTDFNNAVFISNDEAQTLTNNTARIYEVVVRAISSSQATALAGRLSSRLLAAHGGQHDITVLRQGQTIKVTGTILQLLTVLVVVVAAVSLLLGGAGIMNVMLVSVTERMHEIGIRKALGATNRQILRQFVVEAAVLSISGAVIGLLIAAALEILLGIFTDITPAASWQAAGAACLVSIFVGMLFGTIPALKAARKDPISALRNE